MRTLNRVIPIIFHLVLIALLIWVWEEIPNGVKELFAKPPSPIAISIIAYAVTIFLMIAIVFGYEWLSTTPILAKWFKNRELAKFEGKWAQKTSLSDRPFSIGLIQFNGISESWEYSGVGFDERGGSSRVG